MCDGVMNLFKGSDDPAAQSESAQKVILASSALKGVGEIAQGARARKYYKYQQAQALADAAAERQLAGADASTERALAGSEAEADRQLGTVRGDKIRRAGKIVGSQARGAYGASGVSVDSGSALAAQEYIAAGAEEDALTELYTGARAGRLREAEGARRARAIEANAGRRAGTRETEARGLAMQGENAFSGGISSAGRSILSGAASASEEARKTDKWIKRTRDPVGGTNDSAGSFDYSNLA